MRGGWVSSLSTRTTSQQAEAEGSSLAAGGDPTESCALCVGLAPLAWPCPVGRWLSSTSGGTSAARAGLWQLSLCHGHRSRSGVPALPAPHADGSRRGPASRHTASARAWLAQWKLKPQPAGHWRENSRTGTLVLGTEGPPVPSKLAVLTGFYFMLPLLWVNSRSRCTSPFFSVSLFREFLWAQIRLSAVFQGFRHDRFICRLEELSVRRE